MSEVKSPPPDNLFAHAFKLIKDAFNALVEFFFGFTPASAQLRGLIRFLFFVGVLVGLIYLEINSSTVGQQKLDYLWAELWSGMPGAPLQAVVDLVNMIRSPDVFLPAVREILVILVPYFLALEFAAIYQHDVFEKEVAITRTFINQAAFAEHYNVIHVREGRVIMADEDSPILQIGGPGLVEVELDSAIVVENADHVARVIGPSGKERGYKAVLHGFERIRNTFDLRERSVTMPPLKARSRDGIEVEAKEIHYVFSIYRGEMQPTRDNPYPLHPESLINFAYSAPPSKNPWTKPIADNMNGPMIIELFNFISKRSVGDFLASIGQPELEALEQRKNSVGAVVRQLAGDAAPESSLDPFLQPSVFTTRPMMSDIFNNDVFRKNMNAKGFSLRWVGVGTWNPGVQVIPENHLEAWEINRRNVMRGSEFALHKVREHAKYDQIAILLTRVLLEPYYEHIEDRTANELIERWIMNYYERLRLARQMYDRENQSVPESLNKALDIFDEIRSVHWVDDSGEGAAHA